MVWDIGSYEILDGNYWKGFLSVFLSGKKLRGEWTLQRLETEHGKTKWLLRKARVSAKPISKKHDDTSALTGRSMEQIAAEKSAVWDPNGGDRNLKPRTSDTATRKQEKGKSKIPAPRFVRPMKATAVSTLPEGDEWIYEIKWDGYRILALKHGDNVRLLSLKEKNLTRDFPGIANGLRGINAHTAAIDGEVVAIDANGCPSFQALQNRASSGRGWQIVYYAFDLLSLDGADWIRKPLRKRKEKLRAVLEGSDVRYNGELIGSAATVLETVRSAGLEGIVAKQRDSLYYGATRVISWLKLKINKAQEFVIGGYKPDAGSFQSILLGYYEGKELIFCGKCRQGFNPAVRRQLLEQVRPLLTDHCPFSNLPTSRKSHFGEGIIAAEMKDLHWLKPHLIAQVSFTEWTNYGLLRHATFEGLRDDKEPRAVVREFSASL